MNPHPGASIPDPAQRAALNTALHTTGAETGFWDDQGRPAPWPDDIAEWRSATTQPVSPEPGETPF
jgi:hypothetical protein